MNLKLKMTVPNRTLMAVFCQQLGVTEPALKLLLGILAGYPLALIHRLYLYKKSEKLQCVFFTLAGLAIGFWNFGWGIFHCFFSVVFTYFVISLLKASALSVGIVFISTFSYLLTGYILTSSETYDITWTMPYCILVLRLIGVAFDAYDGTYASGISSNKTALKQVPTLLQMLGHSFFPSGFLVGPQFSMAQFLDFSNGKFNSKGSDGKELPPDSLMASLFRFGQGLLYLSIFQMLSFYVSDDLLISDDFAQMCIFKKLILMGLWGRYTLYKYISCWLLTEGACIMFGLSYNKNDKGEVKWDAVTNINLSIFENCTEFNHYIQSFNLNTNQWVAKYIYKRLKFLGNKYVSQASVLLFLAVWHGLHSGYYLTFLHEFIVIFVERDVKSFVKSNPTLEQRLRNPIVNIIVIVLLRLYTFIFIGWALLPFVFLQYPRYLTAFANCNYAGIFVHYLWPVAYGPLLKFLFKFVSTDDVKDR